ncbi:MAG: UrcA family protein [Alphaproteobacteria bacterium]|nr:UrcA family protein [Alphaproteobacteria bacterium]
MLLKSLCPLLALAAAALPLAPAAMAQDGGYGGYGLGPSDEEVIVTAPPPRAFREEWGSGPRTIDLPPEKVSLSKIVHYEDLDLATWQGAAELRHRVRAAARHVCHDLSDAYPFYRLTTSEPCYRDAVSNGLVRADEAISAAQTDYWYRY